MRLSDEELRKHNEYCFQIAKHKCENSDLGKRLGVMVQMPTHLNNGAYRGQLALPCGVIRERKKKINVMQARTGSCVISLAKEATIYDEVLSPELKDNTPYADFVDPADGLDAGVLLKEPEASEEVKKELEKEDALTALHESIFAKGILDIC